MSDSGSSVTLIFYSIDPNWWRGTEPFLNLIAAAAQFSSFTHVEMAIGEVSGARGEMCNVLRIFNDSVGVVSYAHNLPLAARNLNSSRFHSQELTHRTGKNPNYQYVQVGCSKKAEMAMLHFARQQVGKPFSSSGMARSLLWPRTSDHKSWYCAELIAACLQHGGLMSRDSKTGAATPHSLYKLYKSQGAMQANPYTLRQQFGMNHRTMSSLSSQLSHSSSPVSASAQPVAFNMNSLAASRQAGVVSDNSSSRTRSDSPPRQAFRVIQPRGVTSDTRSIGVIPLSLASLNMNRQQH